MILDMTPMLKGEVNKITFDYTVTPLPLNRIVFKEDAHVVGEVTDNAGYMRLFAHVQLAYASECDKCLEPIEGEFELDFERTVADEGILSEEQIEENIDEYVIIEKGKLDIDEQLTEAILLDFPRKLLCSDDCPGLCPKCGKQLKLGPCGCTNKEVDPRWAVLASLLTDEEDNNTQKSKK